MSAATLKSGKKSARIAPLPDGTVAASVLSSRERFLNACHCRKVDRPPVWLMRQAGRALPDYRKLKERYSFL
jgi:uroporphyrinogen decarboxylase